MARADTYTLIPLDRVARHLGIDMWHFNSIYWDDNPLLPSCPDDWYQYDWQSSGKLSRESLAFALKQAEDTVEQFLGWSPLPQWYVDTLELPKYYKIEQYNLWNSQGRRKSVTAPRGYVFEVGVKTSTYIDTPATVFSDVDGDGFEETVTITFATSVTDEDELRVYYPDKNGMDIWEIRPLSSVTITGGVATITFPKYLIADENLLESIPSPAARHIGIDGTVDANFLDEVDVYRVYTDTSDQATFYYEPENTCSSDCEYDTDSGCLIIRNSRLGLLAYNRAAYSDGSYTILNFSYLPSKIKINYRAGWRDTSQVYPNKDMNRAYERLISFYALSLLDTEVCGCDNTRKIWQYMTQDMSKNDGEVSFVRPWAELGSPFGTTRAGLELWKRIQPMRLNRPPRSGA